MQTQIPKPHYMHCCIKKNIYLSLHYHVRIFLLKKPLGSTAILKSKKIHLPLGKNFLKHTLEWWANLIWICGRVSRWQKSQNKWHFGCTKKKKSIIWIWHTTKAWFFFNSKTSEVDRPFANSNQNGIYVYIKLEEIR